MLVFVIVIVCVLVIVCVFVFVCVFVVVAVRRGTRRASSVVRGFSFDPRPGAWPSVPPFATHRYMRV